MGASCVRDRIMMMAECGVVEGEQGRTRAMRGEKWGGGPRVDMGSHDERSVHHGLFVECDEKGAVRVAPSHTGGVDNGGHGPMDGAK